MAAAAALVAIDERDAFAQSGRLDPAEPPRLLNCQPSTNRPAFRVRFNLVGPDGSPLPVSFGSQVLRDHLKIFVDERPLTPFAVSAHGAESKSSRGRIALILVDISGSMNRTLASGGSRFQAAQAALTQFVQSFDEASDQAAIVPFESHNVVAQIRSATFAKTKAQALDQIAGLPAPKPRNNTAIYSSVVAGVEVLSDRLRAASAAASGGAPETLLVIMTDGKNEILPGDDPGLLDGPSGLARAADAVKASGLQAIAIGFGDPGSVDEAALGRISTRSFMATDSEKLKQAFTIAHTLLTDRIAATFYSPFEDRASLEGRTLKIRASLQMAGGKQFDSSDETWAAPQMGVPTFDDRCDTEELRAALRPDGPTTGWMSTVRPLLVFAGIATVLLVLWFWLPRLVWPEQYIGALPTPSRGRWAEASKVSPGAPYSPVRQAPAGFEAAHGAAHAPRGAADRTVVGPEADFSRSRLHRYPPEGGRS